MPYQARAKWMSELGDYRRDFDEDLRLSVGECTSRVNGNAMARFAGKGGTTSKVGTATEICVAASLPSLQSVI
jgi:hypothetical protein